MVSRNILSVAIITLFIGAVLGYGISYLSYPDAKDSPEYQKLLNVTSKFRTHGIPCFPASVIEEKVAPDTWVDYNYDEDGEIMMIGIKSTQKQDIAIWAHAPDGRPGMEFGFYDLHVWFQDIEEVCLDLDGLINKLRGEGLTVEITGEIDQPFFSVKGQTIQVNNDILQVFQYSDIQSTTEAAAQISVNGTTIGKTNVVWAATPHFYHNGKMIILYLGDDKEILNAFEAKIGFQFAGG